MRHGISPQTPHCPLWEDFLLDKLVSKAGVSSISRVQRFSAYWLPVEPTTLYPTSTFTWPGKLLMSSLAVDLVQASLGSVSSLFWIGVKGAIIF